MRILTIAILASALIQVASCDMIIPPWQESNLIHTSMRPVTCTTGIDCDQKWARALKWVKKNSQLPIITQSDRLINTAPSPELSPDPAITIAKIKNDDLITYNILLNVNCGDSFGCLPPLLKLKADFVTTLMGDSNPPNN